LISGFSTDWKIASCDGGHGAGVAFGEGFLQCLESFPAALLDTFQIRVEFSADLGGDIKLVILAS
jgi:hypothetical protein